MKHMLLRACFLSLAAWAFMRCASIAILPPDAGQKDMGALLGEVRILGAECESVTREGSDAQLKCHRDAAPTLSALASAGNFLEPLKERPADWKVRDQARMVEFLGAVTGARAAFAAGTFRAALQSLSRESKAVQVSAYKKLQSDIESGLSRNEETLLKVLDQAAQFQVESERARQVIDAALKADPELKTNPRIVAKVTELTTIFNRELRCTARIEEPRSEPYVSIGFEEPVLVDVQCGGGPFPPFALEFSSPGAVRFSGDAVTALTVKRSEKYPLNVSAMSMTQGENTIEWKSSHAYAPLFQALAQFSRAPDYRVVFEPAGYAFNAVPRFYNASYSSLSRFFRSAEGGGKLTAKNAEIAFAGNGQFTMGAVVDGNPVDLIFGHPNGRYADGIWSSFVTVRVNGQNYRFDRLNPEFQKEASGKAVTARAEIPGQGITVALTLQASDEKGGLLRISLAAHNAGGAPVKVGFRILLDTWAGNSDGVPFTLPGSVGKEPFLHTREVRFHAATTPIWETFDVTGSGQIFLRNTMVGPGLNPPDEIAFVNWGSAFGSEWDYEVNDNLYITGDSAVLLWWKERSLENGKDLKYTTEFNSVKRTSGIALEIVDASSGQCYLHIRRTNDGAVPKNVEYRLSVEGGTIMAPAELKFEIAPGETLIRTIPVTLAGRGKVKVSIADGQGPPVVQEVILPAADNAAVPMTWESGRDYPIQFASDRGDRQIKGRLKSSTGAVLGEVRLQPVKQGENYIYKGVVSIRADYQGEVIVEVVE